MDEVEHCFRCRSGRPAGVSRTANAEVYVGWLRSRETEREFGFTGDTLRTTSTYRITGPYRYWVCDACVRRARLKFLALGIGIAAAVFALGAFRPLFSWLDENFPFEIVIAVGVVGLMAMGVAVCLVVMAFMGSERLRDTLAAGKVPLDSEDKRVWTRREHAAMFLHKPQ